MNLERIIVPKTDVSKNYMVLKKISDVKSLYLCIYHDRTQQKINNGSYVYAVPFKNILGFKGLRPFFVLNESQILEDIKYYGVQPPFIKETKIEQGSVVDYAGISYIVYAIVVNNYAQWNLPTPLLINPDLITLDLQLMYQGKMSDFDIIEKINDNFQNGKYDSDMVIPLVDMNNPKDNLTVEKKAPLVAEVNLFVQKKIDEKNLKFTAKENIFSEVVTMSSGEQLIKLKQINEDIYDKVMNLVSEVNQTINRKINGTPKPKFTEPKTSQDVDLSFLDELDEVFDLKFLDDIDNVF